VSLGGDRGDGQARGGLLAFDPTLERHARLDKDGVVSVRRVPDDRDVRRFPSPGPIVGESFVLAFSPDGKRLAVDYALAEVREFTVWGLDREMPLLVERGARHGSLACLEVKLTGRGVSARTLRTYGHRPHYARSTNPNPHDFLIGGTGKDRIVGSAGHDILVSGDVDSSLALASLRAIGREWAALHSVSEAEAIDAVLDETFGDANSDQLTGGSGADLFIINLGDVITDFQFDKPKTNKDGDVVIRDGVVIA
jgi:Ca2+-binding RTX toxin-like protein